MIIPRTKSEIFESLTKHYADLVDFNHYKDPEFMKQLAEIELEKWGK